MKATVYKTDGSSYPVKPNNGKSFSLEELQKIVGGFIENIYLNDGSVMVVNEEGKIYALELNKEATRILRYNFKTNDFVVGDVIIYNQK